MLQNLVDWFTYSFLHINSHMLNFFIYDTVKILFLLFVMITVIGFLRSFISEEKIKGWVNKGGFFSYLGASAFGALTPFCSCSSLPIFFSFLKMGIPLGVTFAFLITSPIVNEYLVVLMLGFFGLKVTVIYVLSGMLIGIVGGLILGKMKLEKYINEDFKPRTCCSGKNETAFAPEFNTFFDRVKFGFHEAITIIKDIWVWILVGVGIGAVIHNYIPQEFLENLIGRTGVFAVPAATLLGIPMYGSCAAIVPIAVALFQKGVPLGVALSFMMATSALSLPQAVMLKRAMSMKLILIFFGITGFAIMLIGYLFNVV